MHKEIEDMIEFLYNRTYKAYGNDQELKRENWKFSWAWDIIWYFLFISGFYRFLNKIFFFRKKTSG